MGLAKSSVKQTVILMSIGSLSVSRVSTALGWGKGGAGGV